MDLTKLMASARCVRGVREGETPYRVIPARLLPGFLRRVGGAGVTPAAPFRAEASADAPAPAPIPVPTPAVSGPVYAPRARAPREGWWATFVRFLQPRGLGSRRSGLIAPGRLEQGEFLLRSVRPVRNDFSEPEPKGRPERAVREHPQEITPLTLRRRSTGEAATFLRRATGRFFGDR